MSEKGFDGEEFRTAYDMEQTKLSLDPPVKVEFPGHVRWKRHRCDICSAEEPHAWWQRVTEFGIERTYTTSPLKGGSVGWGAVGLGMVVHGGGVVWGWG